MFGQHNASYYSEESHLADFGVVSIDEPVYVLPLFLVGFLVCKILTSLNPRPVGVGWGGMGGKGPLIFFCE